MSSFKGKASVSTSNVIFYSKEQLGDMIIQLQNKRAAMVAAYKGFFIEKRILEAVKECLT